MKRAYLLVLFIVAATAEVVSPEPLFAEPVNSINIGLGGVVQTMPHCRANVYLVEYERMLPDLKISVLGRGSGVDYRFDNHTYLEEGKTRGGDLGFRYYPSGEMRGFYVGGSLGYWKAHWTFSDSRGTPAQFEGKGDTTSLKANLDIGGRFPLGSSKVSIIPGLHFGRFFPSTTCENTGGSKVGTPCTETTEVGGYYFYLFLMAGIGF